MTLRLKSVTAKCFSISTQQPGLDEQKFTRPFVVVTAQSEEGIVGFGITSGTPYLNGSIRDFINLELGPFLVRQGLSAIDSEAVWLNAQTQFNPRHLNGVWSSAVSALDIALWDIKGKFHELPVSRLLGGASDTFQTYVTFGTGYYDIETLAQVAKDLAADGHTAFKIPVGEPVVGFDRGSSNRARSPFNHSVEEDARRVAAVREAIGENANLMVDANCTLSLAQAKRLSYLIEPFNITWFEEPVVQNDARALSSLRQLTSIPIAAGQNFGHTWDHRRLVESDAVDILMPNVCFVGGFTEAVKVANLARAFNLPIANGSGWPHLNLHLQAAMPNGGPVEYHLASWKLGDMIFDNPPAPKDGAGHISDRPGLGFELKWDVLEKYEVDF